MLSVFKKNSENEDPDLDEQEFGDDNQLELTHVGQYEIIKPIGSGGMGKVYMAIDPKKDVSIAIKILDRRHDLDKKRRRRDHLGREILIASNLNHDTIVKYDKEIIQTEDRNGHMRRCLLMEYVDGFDLRKHINDRDLTLKKMMFIMQKLSTGLDYLHSHGIVHRDIKPGNFMVTRDTNHVKIFDFGLSKSNATWRTRFMREAGGTRQYMPPEQLSNKKARLDHRSDLFSFGITMYELFAGHHPCTAKTAKEIQKQLVSRKYRFSSPSKYNSEIPAELDRIILKCLRRNPDKRYQSVTELLLDLSRISGSRI
jgi:serine/threonine-protein kinase